ncbi:CHAT domain-containing protein [Nonomuraea sp. NPDC048882]|uniref:CHAT domain-containing protein n=1 Tax=Nonomuraea sp. NPDC048882 TaxID=3154347 RepID=UPI0034063AA0
MASVKFAQQQVATVTSEIADLRRKLTDQQAAATKARVAAAKKTGSARRTSSASIAERYLRDALRYEDSANKADKKAADLAKSLGRAEKRLADKEGILLRAREAAVKLEEQAARKRRRNELAHARQLVQVRDDSPAELMPRRSAPAPEILRVAYLTASPTGEDRLRVDREVREVREGVRGALHRELIDIRDWPAATLPDLITALNEQRPQLVHFSGHGFEDGLVFDGTEGNMPEGADVDYGLLATALGATDKPPQVVVLNACHSFAGVEKLLTSVPVVIAMLDAVSDIAAKAFAAKFYTAIASGQSLASALKQGQVMMEYLAGEGATVEVIARDEGDLASPLILPPDDNSQV